jgi:hypothetical protein
VNEDDDAPKLGTCCGCGGSDGVRNIIMLDRRGPTPGTGWGCVVCGIPSDGAIVVMCEPCMEAKAEPRFVVVGYPASGQRMPIAELPFEPFGHNEEIHRVEGDLP